jgi:hypothetical protein
MPDGFLFWAATAINGGFLEGAGDWTEAGTQAGTGAGAGALGDGWINVAFFRNQMKASCDLR